MPNASKDKRSKSDRDQPEQNKHESKLSSNRDRSPDKRVRSQESKIITYDPNFAAGRSRADMSDYLKDWSGGWERSKQK